MGSVGRVTDMGPRAVARRKAIRDRKKAKTARSKARLRRLQLPDFPTSANNTSIEKPLPKIPK